MVKFTCPFKCKCDGHLVSMYKFLISLPELLDLPSFTHIIFPLHLFWLVVEIKSKPFHFADLASVLRSLWTGISRLPCFLGVLLMAHVFCTGYTRCFWFLAIYPYSLNASPTFECWIYAPFPTPWSSSHSLLYTPYALLCTGYLCRLQHLDFHSHALCSLSNPHELFVLNIYAQSNYLILHSLCSLNKKLCTGFMCCLPHTVSSLVQGSFNTPFLLSFSVMELFKLYLARSWLLKDFLPAYIW